MVDTGKFAVTQSGLFLRLGVVRIDCMASLLDHIRVAVANDRFVISWHADERCEERGIAVWQIAVGLDEAELLRERPRSKPNPSVVVRQVLADGTQVEAIWSWMAGSRRAKLVTVYFGG